MEGVYLQVSMVYTEILPLLRAAPGPPMAPETAAPTAPVETEIAV